MKAGRKGGMPINFAVDEENQIIHVKTDTQTTDEEFGQIMSELMSIISKFNNTKMLVEDTGYTGEEEEKQSISRTKTFNLETLKYLKKLAICSFYELGVFHETFEYCRNKDIPCKHFNDIEHAKEWLGAE
jgi:hypothetical protein